MAAHAASASFSATVKIEDDDRYMDDPHFCSCSNVVLKILFTGGTDEVSFRANKILAGGLAEEREQRSGLPELDLAPSELLGNSLPPPPAPPARFWTEDQTIRFHSRDYRITTRLGFRRRRNHIQGCRTGSIGEELGTYVAKVAYEAETGQRVLRATVSRVPTWGGTKRCHPFTSLRVNGRRTILLRCWDGLRERGSGRTVDRDTGGPLDSATV